MSSSGESESSGRYEILRQLAVGGMAELFLARSTGIEGFERLVVLKRVLRHQARNGALIRMLLDEARLAATLHHVNIAQVYDIGQMEGTYFFTMEYVHGVDVGQLWQAAHDRGEAIPLEHAIAIGLGTAAGLHYAHDRCDASGKPLGIVHRDVSPSNVLVGYDGGVKLVDFGIAKATARTSVTMPGTIKGKISYMSPEQCRCDPVDRRSDLFSLGVLLYELTTGTLLFDGPTDVAVMHALLEHEIPPPSTRTPGYPAPLEQIVMRCLARDRALRYATARELQLALEAFAHQAHLPVSQAALARYLDEQFGKELEGWRAAERSGKSLAEYVTEVHGVESSVVGTILDHPAPIRRRKWAVASALTATAAAAIATALMMMRGPSSGATNAAAPIATPTASTATREAAPTPPIEAAAPASPSPPTTIAPPPPPRNASPPKRPARKLSTKAEHPASRPGAKPVPVHAPVPPRTIDPNTGVMPVE